MRPEPPPVRAHAAGRHPDHGRPHGVGAAAASADAERPDGGDVAPHAHDARSDRAARRRRAARPRPAVGEGAAPVGAPDRDGHERAAHTHPADHGHAREVVSPLQWVRELRILCRSGVGRGIVGVVALIAVVTIVGLVVLWPGGPASSPSGVGAADARVAATVTAVATVDCGTGTPQRCVRARVRTGSGAGTVDLGPAATAPRLRVDDRVRVQDQLADPAARAAAAEVGATGGTPPPRFAFAGFDRGGALLWLVGALVLVTLLTMRWRGLLALAGAGLSLALVVLFLVPALLAGLPAIPVALVTALAVMFVTTALTNGLGAQSVAAILGITATLLLAAGLAWGGVALARLDGSAGELAISLAQSGGGREISLAGVAAAGMVVGVLGVLADTGVTQASAVMALRRADPRLRARSLLARAITVGRDHLSATIHTLVLAYAGAALPVLLATRALDRGAAATLDLEEVATPAVATVVGCLALIACVPLSTALAAALVARVPAGDVPDGGHHHH